MNPKQFLLSLLLLGIFTGHCKAQINDFKTVDFSKADSIAMACYNLKLDKLPILAHRLTSDLKTDVEKFRAIYMWVCSNVENDQPLYLRNKRKRNRFKDNSEKLQSWNKTLKPLLLKKLKRDKKTICSGYSYLIKILSTLSGLECEFIQGYGRTSMTTVDDLYAPNHSWNAVKLDGKWYLCDATWASGLKRSDSDFKIYEGFFLTDPILFAQNHLPEHSQWLLMPNTQIKIDQLLESPIYYSQAFNYIKTAISPEVLTNELKVNDSFLFNYQLHTPVIADNIKLMIVNGEHQALVSPSTLRMDQNQLTFEYQFKNVGEFELHLFIDATLIASYVFIVNKVNGPSNLWIR